MAVSVERHGPVFVVTIDRPEVKNAVDRPTAEALADAFRQFEAAEDASVGVLYGAHGTFCAGADLKALAGDPERVNRISPEGDAPMGPTRMRLSKPTIAAIEGHAVAGGAELALWCDLRVAAEDAILGFFDRRWGVPLIDGGTVRLPRLIGQSRALDLVLTGRPVGGNEALQMGLVNRVCLPGAALETAVQLGRALANFPQAALRSDRASLLNQWGLSEAEAMDAEFELGLETVATGETQAGAQRFAEGAGRHGSFSC
ncbi:MAG: crotonase/enoyl-CoA hydratase family protein [Actinomycetota bacterium]